MNNELETVDVANRAAEFARLLDFIAPGSVELAAAVLGGDFSKAQPLARAILGVSA